MTTITDETPDYDYDLLAPICTDTEIVDRVDYLIDTYDRRDRSLWLFLLKGDGVQLPVVVQIDDMPISPDPETAEGICSIVAEVLRDGTPGGSAVIIFVRENGLSMTDPDRQWLMALRSAAAKTGMPLRMVCLATREGTRQLTL